MKCWFKSYKNQLLKKINRRKVYARFIDNVSPVALAGMGSISSKI